MLEHIDYSGINRGLKRKVTAAEKAGKDEITVSLSFIKNVSMALDGLVQDKKHPTESKWIKVD